MNQPKPDESDAAWTAAWAAFLAGPVTPCVGMCPSAGGDGSAHQARIEAADHRSGRERASDAITGKGER